MSITIFSFLYLHLLICSGVTQIAHEFSLKSKGANVSQLPSLLENTPDFFKKSEVLQ
ncbi:hypothetical protein [Chamaesiphon sp. VAR_48_metabat_135_sub]|uniref:hypothetical protein n=1 Tax=Chamaesiphon sp. VAR_48_metabat_135_sub TaxID=2964699 RepID=UPI00286D4A76|nr:hypothetical protein [Chamaesiphon sp. VAR_48_metabat_135_sub]